MEHACNSGQKDLFAWFQILDVLSLKFELRLDVSCKLIITFHAKHMFI